MLLPSLVRSRNIIVGLVLAIAATGCAPHMQRAGSPSDTARFDEARFVTSDLAVLPVKVWPARGATKAVVLALHGFNEYGEVFALPAEIWRDAGITTYAYDQRGFGGSPHRGVWASREILTRDAQAALAILKTVHPGLPVYVLGESMGAAVAVLTLVDPATPVVDGAILSAPGVWGGEALNWAYRTMSWLAAHTIPTSRVSGRGLKVWASDNIDVLRQLGRDPRIIKETRVDTLYGALQLMGDALDAAPKLNVPLLVLYGGRDDIIPPHAVKMFVDRLTAEHAVRYYPTGCHMLFRDLAGTQVSAEVASWLTAGRAIKEVEGLKIPSERTHCEPPTAASATTAGASRPATESVAPQSSAASGPMAGGGGS